METSTEQPESYPFEFHGSGREFFGIWIVNLILTMLTLGIYSAWAKVRTNRYFYGNTMVAGSAFEYTADPKRILAGRLVAVGMLGAYWLWREVSTSVAALLLVVFVLLLPFIYVTSISFRMRYSLWRGIGFNFRRDMAGAYRLFAPVFILGLVVMYPSYAFFDLGAALTGSWYFNVVVLLLVVCLLPVWLRYYFNFIGNRVGYGKAAFSLDVGVREVYKIYLLVPVIAIAAIMGVSVLVGQLNSSAVFLITLPVILFVASMWAFSAISTWKTNLLYGGISLDGIRFDSTLKVGKMLDLQTTNILAIVFSLGLAIPWAKVRMARYRAENMFMIASSLDEVLADATEDVNALADAMFDVFDLDIGI